VTTRNAFAFVLHSHLPFVLNHGRWPHGADWLNEAAAETYVPLLNMLRALEQDAVPYQITIGLTPVLCEQLGSPAFRAEFTEYLETKIAAAADNAAEFARKGEGGLERLARRWEGYYRSVQHEFAVTWSGDLLEGFRHFARTGHVEIMTCAATHGYLPLLGRDTAVQAQVRTGVTAHRRHFGEAPRGIWLPECAYRPRYEWTPPVGPARPPVLRKGVDEFLSEEGIKYFIIDTHLLRGGQAIGLYLSRFEALRGLWARFEKETGTPLDTQRSPHQAHLVLSNPEHHAPVGVFTRDPDTGVVVWSGEHGYPGDGAYLEFHKKHFPGGLRYWRVTRSKSDLAEKEPYDPSGTDARLDENAAHFVALARRLLLGEPSSASTILTAPFDAELFGHWWFEGVRWLELSLRKFAATGDVVTASLGNHLAAHPPADVIALPEGSWGQGGFHWIWLNELTAWTWEKIYPAEERMERLAGELVKLEGANDRRAAPLRNVLAQAARSLLLLESSDWQFLISTVSARDYAELRVDRHAQDFSTLAGLADQVIAGNPLSEHQATNLADLKQRDFLFADVNPSWWSRVDHP